MLAARRQRGCKVPDLLIAAVAESRGLKVLRYDADFDLIASASGQRCEGSRPPVRSSDVGPK